MWGSPRIATGAPQFAHVRAGGDRLACGPTRPEWRPEAKKARRGRSRAGGSEGG